MAKELDIGHFSLREMRMEFKIIEDNEELTLPEYVFQLNGKVEGLYVILALSIVSSIEEDKVGAFVEMLRDAMDQIEKGMNSGALEFESGQFPKAALGILYKMVKYLDE